MKINPVSLTITQLLSNESERYVVPPYQRRYSWQEKQIWDLLDDIDLLEDRNMHLLGNIVCLTDHHKAGINQLELADGQQRLTTIYIILQCIADRLKRDNETQSYQKLNQLLWAQDSDESHFRKICLDSLDKKQFEQHLFDEIPNKIGNKDLSSAFKIIREWVAKKEPRELTKILYRLKNQCIVIRLEVSDAKDAFKLFEIINNRGLNLNAADIIKNFILGNASRFGTEDLKCAREMWAILLHELDDLSIETFFRHFLCARLKRRITFHYVVKEFKTLFMQEVTEAIKLPERHLYVSEEPIFSESNEEDENDAPHDNDEGVEDRQTSKMSFKKFLDQIVRSAKIYSQIVCANTKNSIIDKHLTNLIRIKFTQSYSFLMALREEECGDKKFAEILRLTEIFLLRRHICRERTNETEVLFAKLCGIDKSNPLPELIKEFQQLCPSDEKFKNEFANFHFIPSLIERARYCLEKFELNKQGNYSELLVANSENVHVEHIIPNKIATKKAKNEHGDWPNYLGDEAEEMHPNFVSRIGNLTLLAGALNIAVSNNPYNRKRIAYKNSSLKLTKELRDNFPEFRFEQIEQRSRDLADLAVGIWSLPKPRQ